MFCVIVRVIAFQGHPRSLISAPSEIAYATSYYLLIVSWSYLAPFLRYGDLLAEWKLRIFPTPHLFNSLALAEVFRISRWTFYRQDYSPCGIRRWRCRDPSLRRFDTVRACDGQIDGRMNRQTDNPTVANTGLRIASYADALKYTFQWLRERRSEKSSCMQT